MAALHAGVLPMSCKACQCDPSLCEEWGCEEPTYNAAWVDDETEDEYHTCPLRFISRNVYGWYREYSYNKELPGTAVQFGSRPARWIDAMEVYSSALNGFIRERQESARSTGAGPSNMNGDDVAQLKAHFRRARHGTADND